MNRSGRFELNKLQVEMNSEWLFSEICSHAKSVCSEKLKKFSEVGVVSVWRLLRFQIFPLPLKCVHPRIDPFRPNEE